MSERSTPRATSNTTPRMDAIDPLPRAFMDAAPSFLRGPVERRYESPAYIDYRYRPRVGSSNIKATMSEKISRLVIASRSVAPDFQIMLFPHRHGDPLPVTTWNEDKTQLTVVVGKISTTHTFTKNKEGATIISTQTVSDFCKAVGGMAKGMADEQVVYKEILIDGSMASVWTPFKLYINGSFYSCGINSIQMARLNGQWKIQYIIDTRRKENCVE